MALPYSLQSPDEGEEFVRLKRFCKKEHVAELRRQICIDITADDGKGDTPVFQAAGDWLARMAGEIAIEHRTVKLLVLGEL